MTSSYPEINSAEEEILGVEALRRKNAFRLRVGATLVAGWIALLFLKDLYDPLKPLGSVAGFILMVAGLYFMASAENFKLQDEVYGIEKIGDILKAAGEADKTWLFNYLDEMKRVRGGYLMTKSEAIELESKARVRLKNHDYEIAKSEIDNKLKASLNSGS